MKLLLKKAHAHFYRYGQAFFFFLWWPFLYYHSRKPERYARLNFFRRLCAWCGSTMAGIFYRFQFEQPIDWTRTYIICPNHTSNLDISSASILVKGNYCFIGKDELLDNIVTKLFFQTIDIPVNRESKISSFRAFKTAAERLQKGQSVIIFPEGKIPDDYPPRLHEFKNGPFRLAIELKIPIIPVTSLNTWQVLWDTGLERGSKPGVCHIYVHQPIETADMSLDDADLLKDRVFKLMQQKLEQTHENY
ncbi:1-acyl-sn-glycerol-3-phosphate acyltransferase [Mucilaginibacter sp. RS28]|uniref:1-acyl-sn-glycerol-3-phosphate acyltransferase n=1 Tax=Mucilaginibacter straminoryzae TaxID=2932774 RepID=A0A9X1X4E2_9SPHI|nr:lysophospholipid acyltransferase family protein [Mucilaginibacter straminoryzae]MCJ8210897.1 1-acyl-sn-glycerol-3-phosphate acyltransferase [Mucilaginibacter straminoryzae]